MDANSLSRRTVLGMLGSTALAQQMPKLSVNGFLTELSHRAFLFFWERASPETGLVLDRALNSDARDNRNIASSAATGFGLTALCIAASRKWMDRDALRKRALATLRFYAEKSNHIHGWFYHFVDATTGARSGACEVSTIDTALLLSGILTAKQYFQDREISRLADLIYKRLDWHWFLNGNLHLLSMGWTPEWKFLDARWDTHRELGLLYLLGMGAPSNPLLPDSWYAWTRPRVSYDGHSFIGGAAPLFVYQYSQAWVDFRGLREQSPGQVGWFDNSVQATLAHRAFCIDLGKKKFPGCYSKALWGITASDSAHGYVEWGGPPSDGPIDGTIVPCAAGGSLMFEPKLCIQTLMNMKRLYGDRAWNRYGFADAFHPLNGWTNPDVIGIDVGITLLSAENALTGNVWKWFMANPEIRQAIHLARMR